MSIRFFDMFSGIGGFRSGLEAVGGFECIGHCEIDKHANQAYSAIYDIKPQEVYFEDARKINPYDLPHIDLICGGFPCQAFSIAGRRGGFEDSRGTLFFEIARIAAVKRPSYLLLENVPGLLSHDGGRTFATILGTLSDLGYDVTWEVLNNPERECILSDILEDDAPAKYFLSEKQMQRLLCKLSPDEKETESTPQAESPSPSQAMQAVSEEKQDSTI